jgi:membrane protease YdiL (CAAX protease family)
VHERDHSGAENEPASRLDREGSKRGIWGLTGVASASPQGLMLGKLVDVVLRLAPIFAVVLLGGGGLETLYLRKGRLGWSLAIGFLGFANLLATSISIAASRGGDLAAAFAGIPWWLGYSLLKGFMEEIWYRGLFLGRLRPVIGESGALWLTSLVFGISHLFTSYTTPAGALVFGTIVLTLGLAWALLMQRTRTIWGSVIFQAAADLYWFVVFGF